MKYYQKCVKFACNYFKNSSASGGLHPQTPCGFAPHPKPPVTACERDCDEVHGRLLAVVALLQLQSQKQPVPVTVKAVDTVIECRLLRHFLVLQIQRPLVP